VLTAIRDLPATIVGVEAHEKVTADDYGKIRLLYVLGPEFPEFTAGAAWEDTKLGLGRLRHWERIAVVGDADWLRRAIHALSWAMPGEVRVFASNEIDDARAWVTS